MKKSWLSILFLFSSITVLLYGCQSGMQAASFKNSEQKIDTLAILPPHVYVEAVTKTSSLPDEALALKLSGRITNTITTTLKGKYQLENEFFKLDPSYHKEIATFFNNLDSQESGLDDVRLPDWLKNDQGGKASRYFLATFVYSYYHPAYEPNYVMNQSLRTNTLMLGRSGLNWVSIKVLVADRVTNKVLFYNSDDSYQSDPRILASTDLMVKKLIQPVYYR